MSLQRVRVFVRAREQSGLPKTTTVPSQRDGEHFRHHHHYCRDVIFMHSLFFVPDNKADGSFFWSPSHKEAPLSL